MTRKNKEELAKMHWRDRYTYEAHREAESLEDLTEKELVERIRRDWLGRYFAIWRAIGKKGTKDGSAMALWSFLKQNPGKARMLHRYHCADALFRVLGMADPASKNELRKKVQWDHQGEEARQEALLELKDIIEARTE